MPDSFRFTRRTAIITGGSGDIGSSICRELHSRGMNVVVADIDEVRSRALVEELGERAVASCGDLTSEEAARNLIDDTRHAFGGCDLLVNNMAMTDTGTFSERSTASISKEIQVVMVAPIILTRLAIPLLQKSDDPRVITTTSLGGIVPIRETPIYCAAKFGLRGAMLSLALDEAEHGINFSCVLPTATDTYMLRQEAIDGGSVLNFIDEPQPVAAVVRQVLRQLECPRLERYPKLSDSLLARFAMLFPSSLRKLIPLFERKGRRGMQRYLADLQKRGLVEEVDGELRQRARKHLAGNQINQS